MKTTLAQNADQGNTNKRGEPNPRHLHNQLWLLPSGPDQVGRHTMRGGPPASILTDKVIIPRARLNKIFVSSALKKQI